MARYGSASEIRSSRRWTVLSRYMRYNQPFCEACLKKGWYVASEEVHHIVAIEDNPALAFHIPNLMVLCSACHLKAHGKRVRKEKRSTQKANEVNEGWDELLEVYG